MRQSVASIEVATTGRGLFPVTREVERWSAEQAMRTGLLTVFCRHTSASLLIQENADPDVRGDLEVFLATIAPEDPGRYLHDAEGPDDMPAHIRAALTQTSLSIPLADGVLALGRWQGIYLFEHRRAAHRRELVLHLLGD